MRFAAVAALATLLAGCGSSAVKGDCSLAIPNANKATLRALYREYGFPIVVLGDNDAYYCDCAERALGAEGESRRKGGAEEERHVGGDASTRKLRGGDESHNIMGDDEQRRVGGSDELRRGAGAEDKGRSLGGADEERNAGGADEERKTAGADEERKLGGADEGRRGEGAGEIRKAAGATSTMTCETHKKCMYIVKGVPNVKYFDGFEVKEASKGCVK